jgi:hypothetical protein
LAVTAAIGWDNDGLTFTGTGDVHNTEMSSGYTGASGNANVFLTKPATAADEYQHDSTVPD